MKKVFKFVTGRKEDKREGCMTPSPSGDLASPSTTTPVEERFLGLDTASGYIVDFCGKDKTLTKLHKAAWQGNLDKLKAALKKVDIDAVDRHNRSSLHFAVVQGHPNIVWFLLGNNAKMAICDDEGRTPLLKAVECAHKECMTLLLERGADVNSVDYAGNSGLHIAAKQGFYDISASLLKNGIDYERPNSYGEYPLHIGTRSQNKDLVELLLRSGASVNVFDRENRTPLMLAAKNGNQQLAQLFYEYGAQLSAVDSNGWTAEDYAMLGGHQNMAAELKSLIRKAAIKSSSSGSLLETHSEEDELAVEAAEKVKEENDTWTDSLSEVEENKKIGSDRIKQVFEEGEKSESVVEKDEEDSPSLSVVPPPCQPPRSWDIIQAGMIDDNKEGGEGKRISLTTLGSLCSRRESFTDQNDSQKNTLSLNRRREPNKDNTFAKQRLSFNEEESLKSLTSEELNLSLIREQKTSVTSDSDWDSGSKEGPEQKIVGLQEKREKYLQRTSPLPDSGSVEGTLGRMETMKSHEEVWVTNDSISVETSKKQGSDSSWDSGSMEKDDSLFPPPPSDLELGVDLAKSISYIKGVSIDHPDSLLDKSHEWKTAYDSQAHSLDCLDEKLSMNSLIEGIDKIQPGKRHARHQSISNQKWRSEEIPQCHRPPDRLADVNRRINEQLECYDQALRELAESTYAKRQDAIISTLTSENTSSVQNYYSLPVSKVRTGKLIESVPKHGSNFIVNGDYYYDKPPFGFKPFIEMSSGPVSLSFFVNNDNEEDEDDRRVPDECSDYETGNDEKLGAEDTPRNKKKQRVQRSESDYRVPQQKADMHRSTSLQARRLREREDVDERYKVIKKKSVVEAREVENLESPMSDEPSGSSLERKTKRHMLLAMREVKHTVRTSISSVEDQILSPLTKENFQKKSTGASTSSEGESPVDHPFWKSNDKSVGRQETVIERENYKKKSSSSDTDEEEEEPTLWLQDQVKLIGQSSAEDVAGSQFSPFAAVYDEIRKERKVKNEESSSSTSPVSSQAGGENVTPTGDRHVGRMKRLNKSSSSEESLTKNERVANEDDQDQNSGDVSLSSGPIEPFGAVSKDSGSDVESSQNDITPTHEDSLKKHREWLKRNLRTTTSAKSHLEEVAAELTEKAERLTYELADAKEAARSRDEVIILLQGQLAKMEAAYTRSLEDSVHNKLQLTSHEQEIYHLKELCAKYEEDKEPRGKEGGSKEYKLHMKQIEEEKEKLKKEISRLEHENRKLEKRLKETNTTELMEQCQGWKERSATLERKLKIEETKKLETSIKTRDKEEHLKLTKVELENKIVNMKEKNTRLEKKIESLEVEIKQLREVNQDELHKTIRTMNEKNKQMEMQMNMLRKELQQTKDNKKDEKDEEIEFLVDQFEKERTMLKKSFDKILKEKDKSESEEVKNVKEENEKLKQVIRKLSKEERTEVDVDHELSALKKKYTFLTQTLNPVQTDNGQEIDRILEENRNLKKENNNLKLELVSQVPKVDQESSQLVKENTILKNQIFELKKQLKLSNELRNKEKQQLIEYRIVNNNLKEEVNRISTENNKNAKGENVNQEKVLKKRESDKENGEAWKNLYGIKNVNKRELRSTLSSEDLLENIEIIEQKDRNNSKVENLEKELEKAKGEIMMQKMELKLRFGEGLENRRNSELLDMKKQLINLQHKVTEENSLRQALEEDIAKINLELMDKKRLESEVLSMKQKIDRDLVGKSDIELLKLQNSLKDRRGSEGTEVSRAGGDDLKMKCEKLARERQKQHDLRVKYKMSKSISFDRVTSSPQVRGKYHSYPRDDGVAVSSARQARTSLESELTSSLQEELDNSMKKHRTDVPNIPRSTLQATTSAIEMELLKKKYLC